MSPKEFSRCFGILLFFLSSSAMSMDLQLDHWKGRRKDQLVAAWGTPRQSQSTVYGEVMSYQLVALKATTRSEKKRLSGDASLGGTYYVDASGNVVAEAEKNPGRQYVQLIDSNDTYSILRRKSPATRLTACVVHVVVGLNGFIHGISAVGDRDSCARIAKSDAQ